MILIFQRKSSPINGKNFLGDGWWSAPSLGSIIPDASAKIMRSQSLPLRLWLKFLISTRCSSDYEYSFLKFSQKDIEEAGWIESCSKAFFLDTDSLAKIGMFTERKSRFAQNIQVEGGGDIFFLTLEESSSKMTSIDQCLHTA